MDPITGGLRKIFLASVGAVALTVDKTTEVVDDLETMIPAELWSYPSYGDLLYSVV